MDKTAPARQAKKSDTIGYFLYHTLLYAEIQIIHLTIFVYFLSLTLQRIRRNETDDFQVPAFGQIDDLIIRRL